MSNVQSLIERLNTALQSDRVVEFYDSLNSEERKILADTLGDDWRKIRGYVESVKLSKRVNDLLSSGHITEALTLVANLPKDVADDIAFAQGEWLDKLRNSLHHLVVVTGLIDRLNTAIQNKQVVEFYDSLNSEEKKILADALGDDWRKIHGYVEAVRLSEKINSLVSEGKIAEAYSLVTSLPKDVADDIVFALSEWLDKMRDSLHQLVVITDLVNKLNTAIQEKRIVEFYDGLKPEEIKTLADALGDDWRKITGYVEAVRLSEKVNSLVSEGKITEAYNTVASLPKDVADNIVFALGEWLDELRNNLHQLTIVTGLIDRLNTAIQNKQVVEFYDSLKPEEIKLLADTLGDDWRKIHGYVEAVKLSEEINKLLSEGKITEAYNTVASLPKDVADDIVFALGEWFNELGNNLHQLMIVAGLVERLNTAIQNKQVAEFYNSLSPEERKILADALGDDWRKIKGYVETVKLLEEINKLLSEGKIAEAYNLVANLPSDIAGDIALAQSEWLDKLRDSLHQLTVASDLINRFNTALQNKQVVEFYDSLKPEDVKTLSDALGNDWRKIRGYVESVKLSEKVNKLLSEGRITEAYNIVASLPKDVADDIAFAQGEWLDKMRNYLYYLVNVTSKQGSLGDLVRFLQSLDPKIIQDASEFMGASWRGHVEDLNTLLLSSVVNDYAGKGMLNEVANVVLRLYKNELSLALPDPLKLKPEELKAVFVKRVQGDAWRSLVVESFKYKANACGEAGDTACLDDLLQVYSTAFPGDMDGGKSIFASFTVSMLSKTTPDPLKLRYLSTRARGVGLNEVAELIDTAIALASTDPKSVKQALQKALEALTQALSDPINRALSTGDTSALRREIEARSDELKNARVSGDISLYEYLNAVAWLMDRNKEASELLKQVHSLIGSSDDEVKARIEDYAKRVVSGEKLRLGVNVDSLIDRIERLVDTLSSSNYINVIGKANPELKTSVDETVSGLKDALRILYFIKSLASLSEGDTVASGDAIAKAGGEYASLYTQIKLYMSKPSLDEVSCIVESAVGSIESEITKELRARAPPPQKPGAPQPESSKVRSYVAE